MMKRIILTLGIALLASTATAQYVDDLYDTAPAKSRKQKVDNAQQYQQQTPQLATPSDNKELITTYEEAIQRRLDALQNATEMDDAYWNLLQQYQGILETKYDKNLYNIVVIGNDMWVEPQAITALFDGSDPAEGIIAYNDQIKERMSGNNSKKQEEQSYSVGGGGENNNQTIVINLNVDPWYNSGWNYGYYGYGWRSPYYGWGGGWYDPWYSSWYRPYYDPWYNAWHNPWHNPWYHPHYATYNSNPRGTYYGNSASGYSHNGYGGGGLGGARQPRGVDNDRTRVTRGGYATPRPTGINTVNGLGSRGSRGELRGRSVVPIGGVADIRSSGLSVGGTMGTSTRGRGTRETRGLGNITLPTTNDYRNSTTNRPSPNDNFTRSRNTYDRPANRTTYQRPTTQRVERTTTYDRPTTTYQRPSGGTMSRPSGGGMGGGTVRPSGGGRGR